MNSKARNVPWNIYNITKILITATLCLISISDALNEATLARNYSFLSVCYLTPFIQFFTFLLAGILIFYNRKMGMVASSVLFYFWLCLSICGAIQFRSEIMKAVMSESDDYVKTYNFLSYVIYYFLVLMQLLLACFADKPPLYVDDPVSKENPAPEERCSALSKLTFSWFDKLIWLGYKKPLETSDLWPMNPEDTARHIVPLFDRYWEKSRKGNLINSTKRKASYLKKSGSVEFISGREEKKKKYVSIVPALCKAFGPTFIFGVALKVVNDLLTFANPQLLKYLIGYIKNESDYEWKGFLFAFSMLLASIFQTLVLSQYFRRMFIVGLRIRTALISAIYRKSLKMSTVARKESTVGEIVNLMSVDAQRFMDLLIYINMIWSAPLQISLALYFLWGLLGPSVLAGVAVMIIIIPVNGFLASKMKTLQIKQMKYKDERVKLTNEVLGGMKVIKLYAWEPSFEEQILKIRAKEVTQLKYAAYYNAVSSFIWSCAPFLVSLVTFATYVLSDENNILDAKKVFVSLSYFNILRFPLPMMPMIISNLVQTSVSVNRINKFMNCDELDPSNVTHEDLNSLPLLIENGYFSWEQSEKPTLRNINLQVKPGKLVAVVGSVGSGKSSLISSLLGDMEKLSGRVNVKGTVAYVPQQAWIQNATLRDNILFGKTLDSNLYSKVVEACALKPDLEMLPGGDLTEIGEKGINLSGGQKQRVSLARAVYYNADIYLLDDPLSAVDSHVGKHIFEKVIGLDGILKNKTRLLVTHGITYLPQVDMIVVLTDGEISEIGTYRELLDKKGAFAEFLIQHLQENNEVTDIQLEETVGVETLKGIQRQRSESRGESDSIDRRTSVGSLTESKNKRKSSLNANGNGTVMKKQAGEKLIEIEKSEVGSVKWGVYSYYLKSVGIILSVSSIVMNVLFQVFSIGANFWLNSWTIENEASNTTSDFEKRDLYLGVYGGFGIGQVLTTLFASVFLQLGCLSAARILHGSTLHGVVRSPNGFFDVTPLGRVLNRFSKDVDTLDSILPMTIRGWLTCFFSVLGMVVVVSYSSQWFIAVIIPIGILYYFIQRFYVATSRQLKRIESISRSPIYSHFGETVTGVSTIRAYQAQQRFINESESKLDINQICYYPSLIANRWLAVRLETIGSLIIFFSALFGVISKAVGNPQANLVGLSVTYAMQVTQTLNWLVRMTSDVETNIVSVERIKEYGEIPHEAEWRNPNFIPDKNWPSKGKVEFKDYMTRYREGLDLVLCGVNFTVDGGEKIGIVGRTGAGKSSLTLALFRIIEASSGKIFIDGIDISKVGLHDLRGRLTIIPQDPILFSGTIRMNLDPFMQCTDQEIWKALELAHLKTFVMSQSLKLDHEITEGGDNLSVGQRQLICLARALLRKTKILVLDEATAAVDLETDDLIQNTIRREFKECTVLTIAHRLNTILDSDRVLVLDKGLVAEFDSPQKLMSQPDSIFYKMLKDAGITTTDKKKE
ncbi:multidrug resistance protein, putative [Pediculus humanus corporis]|uniref:ABC-type glutathione-S-conjugate transporter n=1 Tax=Pediculus humanus subsp. corporis TaxID=121224 RepID=E0VP44_PEDHC|nr:multidrug resistance protein, putative [Pediculus humanus corporis]EEB15150.1 multidrug resistance protein, putative [Pediculus humanus corporis]